MPELIEVEQYRRALDRVLGGTITAIELTDTDYQRPRGAPPELLDSLRGQRLERTSRIGKLLLLSIGGTDELTLGLRFGMTGRLLVDGSGPIDALEYSSARTEPAWERFALVINGHRVTIQDPRRLGSVELDPDITTFGSEASTLTLHEFNAATQGRSKNIKAVLLDQSLIAGLGNLLVDEVLWSAGVDPGTAVDDLDSSRRDKLVAEIRATVARLTSRGGANTGDSFELRNADAACTQCGALMSHGTYGGRSTWWCPAHQR